MLLVVFYLPVFQGCFYMVEIQSLSFAYPGTERLILKDISFTAEDGEFVCILGQSGCGKSTLLRLLSGLETPTEGTVKFDGEIIKGASLQRGVVFQDYGLFPWMKAGENIVLALHKKYPDKKKKELKEIAVKCIQEVGLSESVFDVLPKALSGGMKQRCAIAQAFAVDPPVLLMDEPFGALDAVTRAKLQDLLISLYSRQTPKKTVFFVTHDVDEAILLASRILVLGQSPSNVIYECRIPEDHKATRETQFEDPEIMKLRNRLIKEINKDVSAHY